MKSILLSTFTLFICVCLQGNCFASQFSAFNDVDEHLAHYADINPNHHDNIDDETHAHTHKHSEDGEEHEHHHEHKKLTHHDAQFFNMEKYLSVTPFGDLSKKHFREARLFPASYPNELFRPPIV